MSHDPARDPIPIDTQDYPTQRRSHGRRHSDGVTRTVKVLGIWCGALVAMGVVLKGGWVVLDTAVTAQHAYTQTGITMQQVSSNLTEMTGQLQQMQVQLKALTQHDSVQDAALKADRHHLGAIDRVVTK